MAKRNIDTVPNPGQFEPGGTNTVHSLQGLWDAVKPHIFGPRTQAMAEGFQGAPFCRLPTLIEVGRAIENARNGEMVGPLAELEFAMTNRMETVAANDKIITVDNKWRLIHEDFKTIITRMCDCRQLHLGDDAG